MTTPPSSPPFHVVLQALKNDFEHTEEQLAALPPLEEVDLTAQTDSGQIQHVENKVFTYHPYKIFIGENDGEPFHAYLTRSGERKHYRIELCSVNAKDETHYEPMEADWFGTVNNLACPFNTFLGKGRFVAVVKWYFMLAFRAGEFDEDPGFAVTKFWQSDLQGACDELIAAPQKEQLKKIRDLEKKAEMLKRTIAKRNRESEGSVGKQTSQSPETDMTSSQRKFRDEYDAVRRRARRSGGPTRVLGGVTELDEQRNEETRDRHDSLPRPRRLGFNEARIFYPEVGHVPPFVPYHMSPGPPCHLPDPRETTRLFHKQRNNQSPRKQNAISNPPFGSPVEARGKRTPAGREAARIKSRFIEEGIVPTNERPTRRQKSRHATNEETLDDNSNSLAAGDVFLRTQEDFEEWKSRTVKERTEGVDERPARRRKSEHAAEGDRVDAADDSAEGNKDNEAAQRMSWTQEVEQLTPTGEGDEKDDVEEEEVEEEPVMAEAKARARREEEWMRRLKQRQALAQQMREIEDEMGVEERLDLFDKVKHV